MVAAARLDPRRTATEIVAEAAAGSARSDAAVNRAEAADLLATLGLAASSASARTAALSEGDRHLVDAARVVALRPRAVVFRPTRIIDLDDDPVWAALTGLRATSSTALVVVSEGLPRALGPETGRWSSAAVGSWRCSAPATSTHPLHPYTRDASGRAGAPRTAGRGRRSPGTAGAELGDDGCPYRSDCPRAKARCTTEMPRLSRPLGCDPRRRLPLPRGSTAARRAVDAGLHGVRPGAGGRDGADHR